MITNNQVDLDELKKTGSYLKKYFVETANSERKPAEIFLALFELTVQYIEGGVDSSQIYFDANEICTQSNNPKESYESAKEFIVRHRKGFDKFIKDNIKEITHFFSLNKVKYLPIIKNTESSGGHKIYFYIGLKAVSEVITHEVELKGDSANTSQISIEYTVPQLPKAPTWAKFLLNFKISGWKFYTYISLPIMALVVGYFLLLWNYYSLSTFSLIYSALFLAIIFSFYFWLKPFYEAIEKRIGIAPYWLVRLSVISAQLRYVRTTTKRKNGQYIRALQLVVYQAECPICCNKVFIEKGRNAQSGRLVGVCDESPREHVFSFDHVTKKGKLII
tara:strand:- start:2935 stop:3933 length:999 start_codon:yes stop_codon:yes gene_type:complete